VDRHDLGVSKLSHKGGGPVCRTHGFISSDAGVWRRPLASEEVSSRAVGSEGDDISLRRLGYSQWKIIGTLSLDYSGVSVERREESRKRIGVDAWETPAAIEQARR
jgi:hypothetical protein